MKFRLSGIPMPPSSNHQYAARAFPRRGEGGKSFPLAKICPTRELEDYQKAFKVWADARLVQVVKAGVLARNWMLQGYMLHVFTGVCWPRTKLWTLDREPKKNDVTDRIKALHDCLALAIKVDDRCFWSTAEKKLETKKAEGWCYVEISPVRPCTVEMQLNEGRTTNDTDN